MIYAYQESLKLNESRELPQPLSLDRVTIVEEKQAFQLTLSRALRADEEAWSRLSEIYEPSLRKDARNLLGPLLRSEVDAEDVVQSVHWTLLSGLRRGKIEVTSAEALLALGRTILRRKIARIWRTLERRKRIDKQRDKRLSGINVQIDADLSAAEPVDHVSAEEQFQRLCKVMTRTERRLIELRLLGYSTAGAAREMGRNSESLRVTLARLRSKLKKSGLLSDFPVIAPRSIGRGRTSKA